MFKPLLSLGSLSIFCVFYLSSCRLFQAETALQFQVRDASGEAIPLANIFVQKKKVAETDAQGQATAHLRLSLSDPVLIEVNKTGSETYYAPYFETIRLKQGEVNRFQIRAILYGIPKPSSLTAEIKEPATEGAAQEAAVPEAAPKTAPSDKEEQTLQAAVTTIDSEVNAEASRPVQLPPDEEESSASVFLYVVSGREQVADAKIYRGDPISKQWSEVCTTNSRGRCRFSLANAKPGQSIRLMARARGMQTQILENSLSKGDRIRFDLIRGSSLEIFTLQKNYGRVQGIAGIKIKNGDKVLGETDSFGSFFWPMQKTEELALGLEAKDLVPQQRQISATEIQQGLVVAQFSSPQAPRPRVFALPLQIQSYSSTSPKLEQLELWETSLMAALSQDLLSQAPFALADQDKVLEELKQQGRNLSQLHNQQSSEISLLSETEWLAKPTLYLGQPNRLELSIYRSQGELIASASQRLGQLPNRKEWQQIMQGLRRDLTPSLPFEGAILEADKDGFQTNLSKAQGLKKGSSEIYLVHGIKEGLSIGEVAWDDLAKAQLLQIGDSKSKIMVQESLDPSPLRPGMLIQKQVQRQESRTVLQFIEPKSKTPLPRTLVYFQGEWIGSSNGEGELAIPKEMSHRKGVLLALKPGYQPLSLEWTPNFERNVLTLERASSPIRIETEPAQAQIRIDGRLLGYSPLFVTIDGLRPQAQLEIFFNEHYKRYQETLPIHEEGIQLTGSAKIVLEKDLRKEAASLIEKGDVSNAVKLLENIGEGNPDFKVAQHTLGDIYLNTLKDPFKAVQAYRRVTQRSEVKTFDDKRFISSHINEGLALFQLGESLKESDPSSAVSAWQKAITTLTQVEPQLRFVPSEQYRQATQGLSYYKALSLHRLWSFQPNQESLQKAHLAWKAYIEGTSAPTANEGQYAFLKKAEDFYKQTKEQIEQWEQAKASNPEVSAQKL